MYSLLPGLVAGLFLLHGAYVIATRGFNQVSGSYFLLCLTTFFWQASWAVLFQVRDPALADALVHFGYLMIIFLPTSLYMLLAEISERPAERRGVALSYGLALVLALLDMSTDLFIAGRYDYFFGFYPKAGPLHWMHVLQTAVVVSRGLWLAWSAMQQASGEKRERLRLCVASVLIYFLAAVDYLCNYGIALYPPGVLFIATSLGLIALAVMRYRLMSPVTIAATVAHEMRTPLASIRLLAETLHQWLPELDRGYRAAVAAGLHQEQPAAPGFPRLSRMADAISRQVERSNLVIDMMLACGSAEHMDTACFKPCSMAACVQAALDGYPFRERDRARVSTRIEADFQFTGTEPLMVFVLYNLLKNALYAIDAANKGDICIALSTSGGHHLLSVRDTGLGIRRGDLPQIFETFFTTKPGHGAGLGLAFCRRVVESFGGSMACDSVEGAYTVFEMRFAPLRARDQPRPGELATVNS